MKIIVSLIIAFVMNYPAYAPAAFYKYYDESGGDNITNDYKSIPKRYRANVITITEKELENKSKARDRQQRTEMTTPVPLQRQRAEQSTPAQNYPPAVSLPAEKSETVSNNDSWLSRQLPLLKVSGIIVLLIAGVIVAGRVVSSLAPRPLATVIRVAMFAALAVYIFKGFSEKVVEAFGIISAGSKSAQKAVDHRSEKIQKQLE